MMIEYIFVIFQAREDLSSWLVMIIPKNMIKRALGSGFHSEIIIGVTIRSACKGREKFANPHGDCDQALNPHQTRTTSLWNIYSESLAVEDYVEWRKGLSW